MWAGRLTNDTLAPLRTVLGTGRPVALTDDVAQRVAAGRTRGSRSAISRRPGFGRGAMPSHAGPPTVSGRWSALTPPVQDPTRRLHVQALTLLERHGILIRGAAAAERVSGGFGALYPVLRALEDAGQCRRGYFVEGLGAAQFALPGAVDRMRAMAETVRPTGAPTRGGRHRAAGTGGPAQVGQPLVRLTRGTPAARRGAIHGPCVRAAAASRGRASSYSRPQIPPAPMAPRCRGPSGRSGRSGQARAAGGHRPGRKAGALVVLADGELVLYVERGGKTLLSWTSDPDVLDPAAAALAAAVRAGALGRLTVERADGGGVYDSPLARGAGGSRLPADARGCGLRLTSRPRSPARVASRPACRAPRQII